MGRGVVVTPMSGDGRLGFHSLDEETSATLCVEGSLPDWLSGTLLRNGPGAFEMGGTGVDHWFDGLAMLRAFTLDGRADAVAYRNRFLRSDAYRTAREGGFEGGFATGESTLRERLLALLFEAPYDNTNVIVERVGDRYLALTETPRRIEVDPGSLETLGDVRYDGPAPSGRIACAHLRRDPATDALVGFETDFGRTNAYHVYETTAPGERTHVASVPVDEPAYMHSFALTPGYVVLTEFPFVVDPLAFLRPGRQGPFIENYEWKPDRGTRFLVIDRTTGDLAAEPRTDAFFGFHHANAYEDGSDLVIDLETVPDPASIATLSLDSLRGGDLDVLGGRLERFRLDLGRAATGRGTGTASAGGSAGPDPTIDRRTVHDGTALPTVSPARWCQQHRYVYAQATDQPVTEWPGDLVRVDVERGEAVAAGLGPDVYPSEPILVPRPDGDREDDGVVLSVALDRAAGRSALLVLDAESLVEIARAPLPHALPFDFHGRFFPELTGSAVPTPD